MHISKTFWRIIFLIVSTTLMLQNINGDNIKVLYLGNSHTFFNDLPLLTYNLALSNGDTISYWENTPGGCTLGHPDNGHLFNQTSLGLINYTDWDYVILQEHSLFGVIDYYRDTYMFPGAKALDSLIKLNNACTKTIVQLIWGKKNGGQHCINSHCSVDFADFSHMQDSLTSTYLRLADTLSSITAPTGVAWQQSIENGDPIELFDPDESHPSLAGSYLAACVYYAVMFQKSPVGLTFTGGLSLDAALYLQQIADEVVFYDPATWNLVDDEPVAGFEYDQVGNTIYCNDTSVNAYRFFWDFGDGATDTVQNPEHEYTFSGTYTITQKVSTDCASDIATDTVPVTISGEYEKYSKTDISIFPGYATGTYKVLSPSSPISQINIYGLNGEILHCEEKLEVNEYMLDINNLPSGLYVLVVKTGNGIIPTKVLHKLLKYQ